MHHSLNPLREQSLFTPGGNRGFLNFFVTPFLNTEKFHVPPSPVLKKNIYIIMPVFWQKNLCPSFMSKKFHAPDFLHPTPRMNSDCSLRSSHHTLDEWVRWDLKYTLSLYVKSKGNFLLQTTRTSRSRLSAGRSQSRTTQNEQATQHRRLLPRRCCTNHGPVHDVLARRTSHLDYAVCQRNFLLTIITLVHTVLDAHIVLKTN